MSTTIIPETTRKSIEDLERECSLHMLENGFEYVPLPLDISGARVDFDARGKGSEKTEWYRADMKEDGALIVTYNSHHSSIQNYDKNYVFCSKSNKPLDDAESEAQRKRVAEMQKKREKEEVKDEKDRQLKAKRDRKRFDKASKTGNSKYLEKKKVGAHGVRFERNEINKKETILLIPMEGKDGEIQALQEIYETKRKFGVKKKPRDKNFTNKTNGLFHTIGVIVNGQLIRVSEGYATAASCYKNTGCIIPHVVAFTAGAYLLVLQKIHALYPDSPILICADNNIHDDQKEENTGIKYAKLASECIPNCSFVYPIFPEGKDRDENGKRYADFNDLMIVMGEGEVKRQIENPALDQDEPKKEIKEPVKFWEQEGLTYEKFPIDVLPETLKHAAQEITRTVQVPIEMAAGTVLSATATSFHNHIIVVEKNHLEHYLTFFIIIVGGSSERKSTTFATATAL